MTRSPRLLFALLVLPLVACQQKTDTGPGGSPPEFRLPAAASSPARDEVRPEPAAAADARDAGDRAEPAGTVTLAQADAVPDDAAGPVRGTDYVVVEGGRPFESLGGKIEVVEVFNYICPACARFEPLFSAWKAQAPPDVQVTYVPAPFNPQWVPYVRAYYAAQLLGLVDETHTAMFRAIHLERTLPGEGQRPDEAAIAAFYGKYGVDPKTFLSDMDSFAIEARVAQSRQYIAREGVDSTPTIIVDGKYRVITRKSYQDVLRVTDALIAVERNARRGAAR